MKKFNIGDKASLKSGGPVMTVIGSDNIVVSCTWFEKSRLHTEVFQAEWLSPVNEARSILIEKFETVT